MKKVSAVIPNYNYATLLERRIASIVNQTARPSEIIFLDDCSTDDSLNVAGSLLVQCDIPWRIIKNVCNQGVFRQWLKGIQLAENDFLWICEADDYCDLNFLETLLPAFNDENVVLAYCQSQFIDQAGDEICNYYNYISRYFDFSRWAKDYKEKGTDEISKYLCCINTIPNASAVIFKKSLINLKKITQIGSYFNNGDWLFYILCLSSYPENKICYFLSPLNYFVRHQGSVFGSKEVTTRPIIEFLEIMLYLLENFAIERGSKEVMLRSLIGNLVYWPVDHHLNSLLTKVMEYLPQDDFYMVYSQETEKILSRLQHKIDTCENRIQEQNIHIADLQKRIDENHIRRYLRQMRTKAGLLLSPLKSLKK